MRRIARILSGVGLSALIALVAAAPAAADVDDFTFSSLDVVYELSQNEDGAAVATVTETFVAQFPEHDQNRGMRRAVLTSSFGQPLKPDLVSVTDETGTPRPASTETEDGYYSITSDAGEYVHGPQTYVFTYTLENVASTMDNGLDEFYWDVNGEEWAQAFDRITAEVRVDPTLEGALTDDAACYAGAAGATDQCSILRSQDAEGRTVFTAEATGIDPYGVMTVGIGFERDTFTEFDASPFASGWAIAQIGFAVLGIGVLVWASIMRSRHLRDSPGRPTIIPEFGPPRGWDAIRSAVLLGKKAQAIPAEILEQAVAGSVRIVEGEKRSFLRGGTQFYAQLLDPGRADENGRAVLTGLFPQLQPGATFTFGRTNNRFAKVAQAVISTASRNIKPWYRKPPTGAVAWPILAGAVVGAGAVIFGIIALVTHVHPALPTVLLFFGILTFIVTTILLVRTPLSPEGAEVRDHLRGLQMFMNWAEADRIRMLQSPEGAERRPIDPSDNRQVLHLYEDLLPFAVIFGIEERWAKDLAVRYGDTSPGWYHGVGAFNAASFSSSMSSLSTSTSSSSSSSGGSSGGGSAGGGGGGGGGGGV